MKTRLDFTIHAEGRFQRGCGTSTAILPKPHHWQMIVASDDVKPQWHDDQNDRIAVGPDGLDVGADYLVDQIMGWAKL